MIGGPDLIVARGKVYTCNPQKPMAEAVAVHKGRIVSVGSNWDIESLRGPDTRYYDVEGALILPGFSDTHTHFLEGALALGEIDLRDVTSKDQFRERLASAIPRLQPGEWLVGGYWNQDKWGGVLPDKSWIDDLSPDNPVMLYRRDIHTSLCNRVTLEAAGIAAATPNPEGGIIVKDAAGKPTGLLMESAINMVKTLIPSPSMERIEACIKRTLCLANSMGITHTVDVISGPDDVATYFDLEREGVLTCRVDLMPPIKSWERFARAGLRVGVGLDLVALGPMKAFLDGSLGSHSALMFEPYFGEPDNRGILNEIAEPLNALKTIMTCVDQAGLQMAVHAIGDRANRIALDMFEQVRKDSPFPALRHRIEHAQHLHPDDIGRFAQLGITAACQPVHIVDDGCYADKLIGPERSRYAYAFRSIIDSGGKLIFGSDWPVADLNPLEGVYAAVTRRTADDRHADGWVPEEIITVEEAIAAYTVNAAYACCREKQFGALKSGLSADMVILDRDIFQSEPDEILRARVLRTFLAGRQVFPEN
jgi:predicted amidohydrolase YtcJ